LQLHNVVEKLCRCETMAMALAFYKSMAMALNALAAIKCLITTLNNTT